MRLRFCAECGDTETPLHESFCAGCYWKYHKLCEPKKQSFEVPYCLTCYSIKLSSGWTGPNIQEELPDIIGYAHFNNFHVDETVMVDIHDISSINWLNPNPDIVIEFELQSDAIDAFPTHIEIYPVKFKLLGGVCTLCIKKKTGSGETIIQFRAKNRKISQKEKDKATTLAFELSSELSYETPEAYIGEILENYGGLDFYVGSTALAEALIEKLRNHWIGHYEKNYKLMTESKDNEQIFSVTHLYRIPQVQADDYVEYDGELFQVLSISKTGVHLLSMLTQSKSTNKRWYELVPVDPNPQLVNKLIVSEDHNLNSYMIMDLQTYETEEVSKDRLPNSLPISEEIPFLKWEDRYYLDPNYQR